MAYSEYWNPKNETLPREQLQALQLVKLQRMRNGPMPKPIPPAALRRGWLQTRPA